MGRRRSYRRRIIAILVVVLASACLGALQRSDSAGAQTTGPVGWLDATVWTVDQAGGTQPLAGVQVVLTAADGTQVDTQTTNDAGIIQLVAPPGTYTLTLSRDGYQAVGSLACGESSWSPTGVSPDGTLHDGPLTFVMATRLCRGYLFKPVPPAPVTPPAPAPPVRPQRPVYLTFDDGLVYLCQTVDMVHDLGIHATFFLTGQAILAFPDCVRKLLADGNVLANHTYAHESLTSLSYGSIINTLQRTEDAALSVAGVSTRPLCRPPYGNINAFVRSAAADWGCRMILWDRDTRDWAGVPVASIVNQATSVSCQGEIVLMHTQAFPRDQYALPQIVDYLRGQGCDMIPVSP